MIRVFFLIIVGLCVAQAQADLRAGVGRASITPDLEQMPTPLGGYGHRAGAPATGVHDEVFVRAIVLQQGDAPPVALVSVELCFVTEALKRHVLERLEPGVFDDDRLFITATHSHTSPDSMCMNHRNPLPLPQIGVYSPALVNFTAQQTAQAIEEARAALAPAEVRLAQRAVPGLNTNRRRGEDDADDVMTVMQVRHAGGEPLAVMINFAAHPTIYGPDMMQISGDWPGEVSRLLEGQGNLVALVVNGAVGDTAPLGFEDAAPGERVARYGSAVAAQAGELLTDAQPAEVTTLRGWVRMVKTPPRQLPPDSAQVLGIPGPVLELLMNRMMPAQVPVSFMQVGPLLLIGVPGEPSTPVARQIREAARTHGHAMPAVAALTNDWIGYILSAQQYEAGGYERSMSFYGPTLAETLAEAVQE